ncbi:MAG: peptidase T [Lachnospiraceae bacterium]|nr:peptidase T [Lachnospiraceae bacterium]MBR4794870.1 peptidase T [Lachnospiraceae bacterium]
MRSIYDSVKERFLSYVVIDTASMHNPVKTPSTDKQFNLARLLEKELREIGVSDVWLDDVNCVVYGRIPSNTDKSVKKVGFVAHMDTSPDVDSTCVKPWVYENYQGGDIILNKEKNIVMEVDTYPNLNNYIGQDIVFTDGTTLLGGDDKAAIASLMAMAEYLINHPEIKHGEIEIAFTPDEEVGGLAKDLDFKRFGAELAYTIDGDYVGTYSYETFNATEAQVKIKGLSVHPGTAKGVMINAVDVGVELINMLPLSERPYTTEGREGYYHSHLFTGNCEEAELGILIRDHDDELFDKRIEFINSCVHKLAEKYGEDRFELTYANGYRSMRKVVEPHMYMIDYLVSAIEKAGVKPNLLPFRGGTDGSAISQRGLPCPNISAGYENGHSRFEFVPIQAMEKNVEILINLITNFAKEEG